MFEKNHFVTLNSYVMYTSFYKWHPMVVSIPAECQAWNDRKQTQPPPFIIIAGFVREKTHTITAFIQERGPAEAKIAKKTQAVFIQSMNLSMHLRIGQ